MAWGTSGLGDVGVLRGFCFWSPPQAFQWALQLFRPIGRHVHLCLVGRDL